MNVYFSFTRYYGFITKCAEYGITDPELVDAMYKMARPARQVVSVMGPDAGKSLGYGPGEMPKGGTRYTPLPKPKTSRAKLPPAPPAQPDPPRKSAPTHVPGSGSVSTNSSSRTITMPYNVDNTTSSR